MKTKFGKMLTLKSILTLILSLKSSEGLVHFCFIIFENKAFLNDDSYSCCCE